MNKSVVILTGLTGFFLAQVSWFIFYYNTGDELFERESNTTHTDENFISNDELIDSLVAKGIIRSQRVEFAMRMVDRSFYCHNFKQDKKIVFVNPYKDLAAPLPYNSTLSAPQLQAVCLEAICPRIDALITEQVSIKILDVGSGSGYSLSCFAHMTSYYNKTKSYIVGIEHIPSLVEITKQNIIKDDKTVKIFNQDTIHVICGDGFEGVPDQSPFHIIHVGAACTHVPRNLFDQLSVDGIMILPLGDTNFYQQLVVVSKNRQHEMLVQPLGIKCRCAPLTDRESQLVRTHISRAPKVFNYKGRKMVVTPFIINAPNVGRNFSSVEKIRWE
ncbi:L-isoaspartate O-methyltransferase [Acrasis kona]|uniref:protein-L-isoaspartate(D-aspartate) O-methyltransferase n=1 Tax=Acrasis kona TaxID=1008807 RepID=A0AAW2ZFJ0_9EUKA